MLLHKYFVKFSSEWGGVNAEARVNVQRGRALEWRAHLMRSRECSSQSLKLLALWLNFFPPILEHFCPLFQQIAQVGLILPRWGLILLRVPLPTPILYSAVTNPFQGYIRTQNTPNPTPKHPFSCPDFESGQNELLSEQKWTPTGQNIWKVGKTFLEVGKKKLFRV